MTALVLVCAALFLGGATVLTIWIVCPPDLDPSEFEPYQRDPLDGRTGGRP